MAEPTLIVWIDSLDEGTHNEERVRLHALGAGINNRAHRFIDSKLVSQVTVRPENEAKIRESLPSPGWLSTEQISIWQLSGLVKAQYDLRIIVVCLDPMVAPTTLDLVRTTIQTRYANLQIPIRFTLIWYKAGQSWQKGSCAEYWPRFAVSDRVTDWQNVLEHLVIAGIDSGLGAFLTEASGSAAEVVWCGAAGISLGMQQAQLTVRENMYRRMIEVLRADDLTQEEVDASKVAARHNRIAYARDMMSIVQKQVNEHFDFTLQYEVVESADAPVVLGQKTEATKNRTAGFDIRKGSALGTAMFGRRADWWLASDTDFSAGQMLTELLNKDTVTEQFPANAELQQQLVTTFTRLHDRVTLAVRESSQQSLDRFFAHIFSQIESQSSYGLRNIQQSLQDFLEEFESGSLLTYKGKVVTGSRVATHSFFSQQAFSLHSALTDAMAKISRRRRNVVSLPGSILRMILIIPILNGIFSLVGPAAYQDLALFLIPVAAIAVGVGSALESYRQFHLYARQVRNQYTEEAVGGAVLSIIQSAYDREREQVSTHLRHLNTIYRELIDTYDQTHAEQVKPLDLITPNAWALQQIDTVWGEAKMIVRPEGDNLGDWDLVIGEEVTTYRIDGQTRLSFESQTQVEVNRDAREKGLYRGSVLLLQQVADQLRRRPLTKQGVESRMRDFCNTYVKRVFQNPMNKLHLLYEINRSANVVMPATGTRLNRTTMLGDGKHWTWLHMAANQNVTPRAETPASTRDVSVLLVPDFLGGSIEGRYGRPSSNWVEPSAIVPLAKAFDEELIHVRMDIDYVK